MSNLTRYLLWLGAEGRGRGGGVMLKEKSILRWCFTCMFSDYFLLVRLSSRGMWNELCTNTGLEISH